MHRFRIGLFGSCRRSLAVASWSLAALLLVVVSMRSLGALAQEATSTTDVEALGDSTPDVLIDGGRVIFPPLSRDSIDRLFDALRGGGGFQPRPLVESQVVDPHTAGIWAGTKTVVESSIGEIVLRFRPTAEARLQRASGEGSTSPLAEWFDVKIDITPQRLIFTHPLAVDRMARAGLEARFAASKRDHVITEYIQAGREAGLYVAVPAALRDEMSKNWGILVCPRVYTITPVKESAKTRLELFKSPYELVEVRFALVADTQARMSSASKAERLNMQLAISGGLPSALDKEEEVTSLLPIAQLPYRPSREFDFIKFPLNETGLREGFVATVSMTNMAGHLRAQHHSHVLYVERISEPSPVSVVVRAHRPVRDEGDCYIVSEQRSVWNRYSKVAPPSESGSPVSQPHQ